MDADYITPFVTSIQNVFSTMLQLPVTAHEPVVKSGVSPTHDVSGIIGMSGDVVGTVILSFRLEAAQSVVALFCGERLPADSADFADAVGELVNMVSGGAKALFADSREVSISCPSVIVGEGHGVSLPSDIPCMVVPCSTDCGDFVIEIAIREATAGVDTKQNSTAANA